MKSNDVCLRYSEQYLEDEPRELIKGCLHLDASSGYIKSKGLLQERYGDPYKISNAYIKKINEWPYIRAGDDLALEDRYSTFLIQCHSASTRLSFLAILDHPHNMQILVKKLPLPLQDSWRRQASKLRVSLGKIPAFAEFLKFVKNEAGIAMDPVFSREALSHITLTPLTDCSSKDKLTNKSKPSRSYISSYATTISTNSTLECLLCKEAHDLDDCQAFMKKFLQDLQILADLQYCEHPTKTCPLRF